VHADVYPSGSMANRCIVFGNPSAQSGRAKDAIDSASALLTRAGCEVVVVPTEPEGRTPALVTRTIAERAPDTVIALGGDGTFNEIARGILASGANVRMGMIPMGTANDQGRSFGLVPGRENVESHVAVVLDGHVTHLDVGAIDALDEKGNVLATTHFFDSASFGFAPDILAARNRDRRDVARIPLLAMLYRDQAVYVGAALDRWLNSFVEPLKFACVVTTDTFDRSYLALTDLVVKATPIFAGAWVLDRRAEPDDGLFELVAVASRREWGARVVGDLAHNPIRPEIFGLEPSEHLAASRFKIDLLREGENGVASQIDGEEWVRAFHFAIRVEARRLPLLTPRGFVPPWR
jgi:diacylglycerol kinase family enzyme